MQLDSGVRSRAGLSFPSGPSLAPSCLWSASQGILCCSRHLQVLDAAVSGTNSLVRSGQNSPQASDLRPTLQPLLLLPHPAWGLPQHPCSPGGQPAGTQEGRWDGMATSPPGGLPTPPPSPRTRTDGEHSSSFYEKDYALQRGPRWLQGPTCSAAGRRRASS